MILREQNILFFLRATQHGGTENIVLQLCEIFHPLVNKIVIISANGFAVEKLKQYGIKHICIPDIESKSISTVLSVIKILKKTVVEEHITVIHTHHRMAAFYVRITGLYRYCRFINTSHNTFTNKRVFTRYAYKKANLIACGEMVKKNLEDVYGLENVTAIRNAVKIFTDEIVTDEELSRDKSEGKYLIGNIGRLSEQKGFEYYLKAIPKVIEKHPKTQFYIIGSGEDEKKLKEMGKWLPVKFLGYRTNIQNLMAQLDIIVLSSLWEGLPLTPIEAFSVGKTIVATGVDGTLEIVKDKVNGLLIEPRKPDQIAEKINWLIEYPEEKGRMEESARKTFENKFSFDILAQSYTDYYRSL